MTKDLIGKKFGMLTILERKREKNRTYLYCKCECGNEKWIRSDSVTGGKQVSCGCLLNGRYKQKDLSNTRQGKLFITDKFKKEDGVYFWLCKCDCGNKKWISSSILRKSKSCGCDKYDKIIESQKMAYENYSAKYIKEGTNLAIITNKKNLKTNKSGIKGVCWDKARQKWVAQIEFQGKNYRLGRFDNIEDAVKVRKDAEEKRLKYLKEKGLL